MTEYMANQCKACMKYYMTTSKKYPKCAYCNSGKHDTLLSRDKPKLISEYIRRQNGKGHYKKEM